MNASRLRAFGLAVTLLAPALLVAACSPGGAPRAGNAPSLTASGATGDLGQSK